MAIRTMSREQARRLDHLAVRDYAMSGVQLMENAGRGVVDRLCALGIDGPVAICCGHGNNGGDGFVVARHLDLRGFRVRVLLLADPARLRGDAALNFQVLKRSGVPIERPQSADLARVFQHCAWIVDALLGTGATGEPRSPLAEAIDAINQQPAPVLAIDLPSGLDCDTGQPAGHTVRAAHTVTFVAKKPGFLAPGAASYTGQVHVADIGAPRKLVDEILGPPDGTSPAARGERAR